MRFITENNIVLSQLIRSHKAFVFDLDNTLYQETDFLFFVYHKMHAYLSAKYGDRNYATFLKDTFVSAGRTNIIDKMIEKFSLPEFEKDSLLALLRTTIAEPRLSLYHGARELISLLIEKNVKIFVLTNGNPAQQENKVKSIEWGNLRDHVSVYYANRYEKKPSPKALLAIIAENGLRPEEVVFIGDAETDRLCAYDAGVTYVPLEKIGTVE